MPWGHPDLHDVLCFAQFEEPPRVHPVFEAVSIPGSRTEAELAQESFERRVVV